jgi:hypothetical protein
VGGVVDAESQSVFTHREFHNAGMHVIASLMSHWSNSLFKHFPKIYPLQKEAIQQLLRETFLQRDW